ncbi:MAG: hypothetical protein GWO02_17070, partial [Gammaproteobacteria bacterium]|nr:hypothetical protein [Gammaproteobacteria bacterium]
MRERAELGPAMRALGASMATGQTPEPKLVRRALKETLAGQPPADTRLATLTSLLAKHRAPAWEMIDAAARRWRAQGLLGPRAIRRLCDAALAGERTIDETLAAAGSPPWPARPFAAGPPLRCELRGPAAHAREKAAYISDLIEELTGKPAEDVVDPLARLFATSADEALHDAHDTLCEIATPIPGFPFLGQRGGDKHYFFLTDALRRAIDAGERGVAPIPVIAMPKTGSAFITTVLARVLDVPVGVASLQH